MENDLRIIMCNENAFASIFSDIVTFGILAALLFINYNWLGDSTLILLLIVACFFTKLVVYGSKKIKKMSPKEALEYLQANQPPDHDTKSSKEE